MNRTLAGASTRTIRRAFARHGQALRFGDVGKHSRRESAADRQRAAAKAEVIHRGRLKTREFWLRAGILAIPYEDHEVKTLLAEAKDQFDNDGVIDASVAIRLGLAGYDVERVTEIWSLMKNTEVDEEALAAHAQQAEMRNIDVPLNSFE